MAAAGYWFGNAGVGLAALWLALPPGVGRQPAATPSPDDQAFWLSERRVSLRSAAGQVVHVYRDEMSPADWAALKRQALSGQLATGRSTSI